MSKMENLPRITKVWAKNFRSIRDMELELDELTVLVGPNASGKSNVVDVLHFISDAFRNGLQTAITKRGGIRNVNYQGIGKKNSALGFSVSIENNALQVSYYFSLKPDANSLIVNRECCVIQQKHSNLNAVSIELSNGKLKRPRSPETNPAFPKGTKPFSIRGDLEFTKNSLALAGESALNAIATKFFLASHIDVVRRSHMMFREGMLLLLETLRNLKCYRLFPNQFREPQKLASVHPLDEQGENLASVLQDMIRRKSAFYPDLLASLQYAVPHVKDIRVSQAGSFLVVELKHGEGKGKNAWFDLSFESDGTLRLLGLLAALYQDPTPPFVAIEEPELTIHPGALAVVADVLKEGPYHSQVLVTTHSPDLLDRLPVESIRVVEMKDGATVVGKVADYQVQSVKERLFGPGELQKIEGLQRAS